MPLHDDLCRSAGSLGLGLRQEISRVAILRRYGTLRLSPRKPIIQEPDQNENVIAREVN